MDREKNGAPGRSRTCDPQFKRCSILLSYGRSWKRDVSLSRLAGPHRWTSRLSFHETQLTMVFMIDHGAARSCPTQPVVTSLPAQIAAARFGVHQRIEAVGSHQYIPRGRSIRELCWTLKERQPPPQRLVEGSSKSRRRNELGSGRKKRAVYWSRSGYCWAAQGVRQLGRHRDGSSLRYSGTAAALIARIGISSGLAASLTLGDGDVTTPPAVPRRLLL